MVTVESSISEGKWTILTGLLFVCVLDALREFTIKAGDWLFRLALGGRVVTDIQGSDSGDQANNAFSGIMERAG